MEGIAAANWPLARLMVRRTLDDARCSVRSIAQTAGLPPSVLSRFLAGETTLETGSALRLYRALHPSLETGVRHELLRSLGLLPLLALLCRDALALIETAAGNAGPEESFALASRLMAFGTERLANGPVALAAFRQAEQLFGRMSSQSARAAILAAQVQLNLCDYEAAWLTLERIRRSYAYTMDVETQAEFYRLHGWLYYYLGYFPQALSWLNACLALSRQVEEPKLSMNAHLLQARTYRDWATTLPPGKRADTFFQQASAAFDTSYQAHLRWSEPSWQGCDLFRKAQLFQFWGQPEQARELRLQSRQLLGSSRSLLHLDLEDTRLEIENGAVRGPRHKTTVLLEGWGRQYYAKGIADTLRLLGTLEQIQGQVTPALEYYLAALCVYPYEHHLGNRCLLAEIRSLLDTLGCTTSQNESLRTMITFYERAISRNGPFEVLNALAVDRKAAITRIFTQISGSGISAVAGDVSAEAVHIAIIQFKDEQPYDPGRAMALSSHSLV